ncbi:MAG: hypothetical protein ACRCUJ_07865 [Phocaeicola sp.]
MKTLVACVAESIKQLKETIHIFDDQNIILTKGGYIYCRDFRTIEDARVHIAMDCIKNDFIDFEIGEMVLSGELHEFKVNDVTISMRCLDERKSFLEYIKKSPFTNH